MSTRFQHYMPQVYLRAWESKVVSIKDDVDITPELEEKIIQATPKQERKSVEVSLKVELRNRIVYERRYPSQEGKPFKVPQLQLFVDDDWTKDYDEYFIDPSGKWLLEYPATLTEGEFRIRSTGTSISIDINGNHIEDRYIQETLALNFGDTQTDWTIPKLAIWVTQQIPDNSIAQQVQVHFVRQLLENLCIDRGIALNDLRTDPSTLNFVDCCITCLLTNLSYIWTINDNYRLNEEEKQLKLIKSIQNIEE